MNDCHLTTERLILRRPRREDAEALARWLGDECVARTTALVPHPYTLADAEAWLERTIAAGDRRCIFVITLRDSGELIGGIGFHELGELPWAEFGYWIGRPWWGRGFATEALVELLRHGFADLGLRRIEAHYFIHNPASGRVMQKAGMRREGVQHLRARRFDTLFDRVNYGLTDEEWRSAANPAKS